MKKKEIDAIVRHILSERKYEHTLRTARYAEKLAEIHGADPKKIYKAALLHDVGYFVGRSKKDRALSHARISERYARRIGVKDPEILEAIRWHTVGKPGLSDLSKILYLADGIEPARKYPSVEIIRELAESDLDSALLLFIEISRNYLHKKGKRMSTNTIKMRDEILKLRKNALRGKKAQVGI